MTSVFGCPAAGIIVPGNAGVFLSPLAAVHRHGYQRTTGNEELQHPASMATRCRNPSAEMA